MVEHPRYPTRRPLMPHLTDEQESVISRMATKDNTTWFEAMKKYNHYIRKGQKRLQDYGIYP